MHGHEHDADCTQTLRPKAARLDETPPSHVLGAAASGRADVLDATGVLRLQRAVGNQATGDVLDGGRSPVHDVVGSGGGSPLAPEVRHDMETRLGHDFGDVRVHTDSRAHESATAVGAHAYTVGSDVVFQRGRFDPSSTGGRTTLAHELTHVVQQRRGAVDGTPAPGGIRVSDPSDHFEREAVATAGRVMSAPAFGHAPALPAAFAGPAGAAVQRQAAPAEEAPQEEALEEEPAPVQGLFVQRETEAGEGEEPAEEG
jgi:hypothetical protein